MSTDFDFLDKQDKMNEKGIVYGSLEKNDKKENRPVWEQECLATTWQIRCFKVLPSNHTVDKLFYKIVQKPYDRSDFISQYLIDNFQESIKYEQYKTLSNL